jgi:hypothetical protein
MDDTVVRQQAAETLRELRNMERRTRAATARSSPVPLAIFGTGALLAAPLGLIDSQVATAVALGVALLGAVAATGAYHSRQPVHAADPVRRSIGITDVVVWLVILFLAVTGLPTIFLILSIDATMAMYLLFTAVAIAVGKRIHNDALAIGPGFALMIGSFGLLIDTDYWRAISTAFFGGTYLIAALLVHIDRRQAA